MYCLFSDRSDVANGSRSVKCTRSYPCIVFRAVKIRNVLGNFDHFCMVEYKHVDGTLWGVKFRVRKGARLSG